MLFNLSGFRDQQALKNNTEDIISILNKARQNTLSSLNSTNYSVHFETNKVVLFVGSTYSSVNSSNEQFNLSSVVNIPISGGINVGGGSDVVFERLTGETIGGTIILRLISDSTKQKTIIINKTGIVSSN